MRYAKTSQWLWLLTFVIGCLIVPVSAQDRTPQELADPDGQFLDVGGVSIYIQVRGDASNPAVILLHGFGGSTFTWRNTLDPLVEAGYYVVAMDLPPFGLSDKSADGDYTRTGLANTVIAVMNGLKIDKAVIVGHSMGGEVTAYLGAQHPERVSGLIFVSGGLFAAMPQPTPDANGTTPSGGGFSDLSSFMDTIDPKSPLAAVLVRAFFTPQRFTDLLESAYIRKEVITPELIAGYQRPLSISDWPQGLLAFSAAKEQTPVSLVDLTEAVDSHQIPVLILWGKSDPWVSIVLADTMHAALTGSEIMTYDGVGHLPMEENTAAFNADVAAFLRQIKGA